MQRSVIAAIVGLIAFSAVLLGLLWGAVMALILTQQGAPLPGGLVGYLVQNVFMFLQWALGVGVCFVVVIWLIRRGTDAEVESDSDPAADDRPGEGYAEQAMAQKE